MFPFQVNVPLDFGPLGATLVWLLFGFTLFIVIVASIVLLYHWGRYGHGPALTLARTTYLIGIAVLMVVLLFVAIAIQATV